MLEILPIPAFKDNYIWLIHNGQHAVVVDPGDAEPVITCLQQHHLQLDSILITHHHDDHIGGVETLVKMFQPKVFAPAREKYAFAHMQMSERDTVDLANLNLSLEVIELPGHTLGHIAYYAAPYLFCGDTLFSCGCGRLFEGTAEQMYQSLQKLVALPKDTQVYCTHEYTAHNIGFARQLDPNNTYLQKREMDVRTLRAEGRPSLPTTIGLELQTNPFLRCNDPAIQKASQAKNMNDPVEVFSIIRNMRNNY